MPQSPTTASLYARRRSLTVSLTALEREIAARRAIIGELEAELATRLLFVSAYRPRHPVPTVTGKRLGRAVLGCLRDAERMLTTPEIAARVMAAHGVVATDPKMVRAMWARVRQCLERKRRKGFVVSVEGEARLVWGLA